jgi:hypothetical protein
LLPVPFHAQVTIGLYNGGMLVTLADTCLPDQPERPEIAAARATLQSSPVISTLATLEVRPTQITVEPVRPLPPGFLRRAVAEALSPHIGMPNVHVLESGHSVDVFPATVSKWHVVERVQERVRENGLVGRGAPPSTVPNYAAPAAQISGTPSEGPARSRPRQSRSRPTPAVLTLGDQGRAGGNDAALLAHPLGLCVDNPSTVLGACWHLAPAGERRSDALLRCLRALRAVNGVVHFFPGSAWSNPRATRRNRPELSAPPVVTEERRAR